VGKSLVLASHLLDDPVHGRLPRRQKTVLTNTPWRKSKTKIDAECTLAVPTPHGGSLSTADFDKSEWKIMYPLFIEEGLIGPSECVNKKTPDVLYFTCMFVLCFTFRCLHYVCLRFPPSSEFSTRLHVLVDPFIVKLMSHLHPGFLLRSGTSYSFIHYPWDCALVCLLIESLEFYDRSVFYFINLVGAPGHLDIHSFWNTFVYVSKLFLSPLSFGGFGPSKKIYASAI
jgi:hypothetical protein